jgi:NADH dehydrogenase
MRENPDAKTRVVIVGAGFAGLWAARRLARERRVAVALVDRNNYHAFLPLLYQVAAAELEPEQIAYPIRGIFRRCRNVTTIMAEARGVDFAKRIVFTEGPDLEYDHLILAPGSSTAFFGVPGALEHSFTLKSLEDAVKLRNHLLACFERAALGEKLEATPGLLTIAIVGGGPTGLEYAGALAELVNAPLARDFPALKRSATRIVLIDGGNNVLTGFPDELRDYARQRLIRMGVDVRTGSAVTRVEPGVVHLADGTAVKSCTIVWTAGVCGNDLGAALNLPLGRAGRVEATPDLLVKGHGNVHVAGDLALPAWLASPALAPCAIQQGRHAAENVLRIIRGEAPQPFRYMDKGSMVTIGRNAAVARIGGRSFSGFVAWVLWLTVHLSYLIGFRNRLLVLINWAWDYLFRERAVRLIMPKTGSVTRVCGKGNMHECGMEELENKKI